MVVVIGGGGGGGCGGGRGGSDGGGGCKIIAYKYKNDAFHALPNFAI